MEILNRDSYLFIGILGNWGIRVWRLGYWEIRKVKIEVTISC